MVSMLSNKPYLIKALYQWIVESECTPYLVVNTSIPEVNVPKEYIKDERIILNIAPIAIRNLLIGNQLVEFSARFSGVERHIEVPTLAVLAIYAVETGRGMVFEEEPEDESGNQTSGAIVSSSSPEKPKSPPKSKPNLTIVK